MIAGGADPTALKNEKGARLAAPSAEMVDTKAIGLGITQESKVLKFSRPCRFDVINVSNFS